MPLHNLIALVVLGILGIAALTYALGYAEARRFENVGAAQPAWLREFPEVQVKNVTLCRSGAAALIATDQGPGIVWARGPAAQHVS